MNQKKIGDFLKTMRKEKGITQEQLAQELRVSTRTISRWETGFNMPDLSILMEISDYYDIELKEILNGERSDGGMDKETVKKVADFSIYEKQKLANRVCILFILGFIAFVIYLIMVYLGVDKNQGILENTASFSLGFAFAIMIIGVLYISGLLARSKNLKMRLLKNK